MGQINYDKLETAPSVVPPSERAIGAHGITPVTESIDMSAFADEQPAPPTPVEEPVAAQEGDTAEPVEAAQ